MHCLTCCLPRASPHELALPVACHTRVSSGRDAILAALEREHSKYEHTTYYPVAVAANDEARLAFVAVAWEYKAQEGEAKDRWVGGWVTTRCAQPSAPWWMFWGVPRLLLTELVIVACRETGAGMCVCNMAGVLPVDACDESHA